MSELEVPAAPTRTTYTLLVSNEDGSWKVVATQVGNAEIREHMRRLGGGSFVTCPTRSWNPQKAKIETQERLIFS